MMSTLEVKTEYNKCTAQRAFLNPVFIFPFNTTMGLNPKESRVTTATRPKKRVMQSTEALPVHLICCQG